MKSELKIGFGNPGRMGCASMSGEEITWQPILDKQIGVVGAFNNLDLAAVGLPGARLPSGITTPPRSSLVLDCRRGEHSYASCALARTERFADASHVKADSCTDRSIWLDVPLPGGGRLSWVIVQFPTKGSADRDAEWLRCLAALEKNVLSYIEENPTADLLVTGDFNIQPDELQGPREVNRTRQLPWTRFLRKTGLTLLNPLLSNDELHRVWLPLRERYVDIFAGTTRHDTDSCSTLDLVLATSSLEADVLTSVSLKKAFCWI